MEMLSYKQAAERLGVPLGTVYSWVCKQKIPHHRFGPRLVRFDREQLDEWIANHRVESTKQN